MSAWTVRYCAHGLVVTFVAVTALTNCTDGGARPPPAVEGPSGSSSGGNGQSDAGPKDGGASTCKNTVQDNGESDIDCGGPCEPCELGKKCNEASDCAPSEKGAVATCTNGICAVCDDRETNGSETDVDCGGTACGPCTVGKRCKVGADCTSGICDKQACACPPNMVVAPLPNNEGYCIDATEVTKGQYHQFWKSGPKAEDQQDEVCRTVNTDFVPRKGWPPATSPLPETHSFSLPVHYVDWCDAVAYCRWAQKELCGQIGGGPVALADRNVREKSAWYNACSAQGNNVFPYGDTFLPGKCNGPVDPPLEANRYGAAENDDEGIYTVGSSANDGSLTGIPQAYTACNGGAVGLYQMSGNVAEWENSCSGDTADAECAVRGGSYLAANDPNALSCAASRTVKRMPGDDEADLLKDIGFRCCKY